ncbi:hypothetical protein QBC38DRAFT_103256 [Podospora fimiseda]|uniref:Uncharacterized protein n=1 Tax=Podospora fimiseda TaxID=252190 RepID=A0AAN6YQG5_9PEZI|nr:hypothetical protein QBC38DRAFT_103256 [Podospora fimiseda]
MRIHKYIASHIFVFLLPVIQRLSFHQPRLTTNMHFKFSRFIIFLGCCLHAQSCRAQQDDPRFMGYSLAYYESKDQDSLNTLQNTALQPRQSLLSLIRHSLVVVAVQFLYATSPQHAPVVHVTGYFQRRIPANQARHAIL